MKSEHRHELQTNELSAGLAHWIDAVKPYTGQIITGVVALIIVYAGLSLWNASAAQKEQEAWEAYAFASDSSEPGREQLLKVANNEKFAGTAMQEWAYVGWADGQVGRGIDTYLSDRELSKKFLDNAAGVYENLATGASDPQVLNRARFGLARVFELQNEFDKACEQYQRVQGDLQQQASDRAKHLESKEVRETCTWLATTELPERDLTGGQGASGARPDFDATLPGIDAVNMEALQKMIQGGLDTGKPAEEDDATDSETATDIEATTATETTDAETDTDDAKAEEDSKADDAEAEADTDSNAAVSDAADKE